MSFNDNPVLTSCLDFRPLPSATGGNALPDFFWKSYQISGFTTHSEAKSAAKVDLAQLEGLESFDSALWFCYRSLSLPELARLYQRVCEQNITDVDWNKVFAKYSFRFDDRLESVIKKLVHTPQNFQNWCSDKGLGVKDLQALVCLESFQGWEGLFNKITQLNKNWGAQSLEWCVELFLMGHSLDELFGDGADSVKVEDWYEQIKMKRFPMSSNKDLLAGEWVNKLNWPQACEAKWVRKGDDSGLEIKLFVKSPSEFDKKMTCLIGLSQKLQDKGENPWKI